MHDEGSTLRRVSTDGQQKEGTIDSQIIELKRQIAAAPAAEECN
jgi:hypothetical protein